MALHDPESTAAEKALALRIGRQKKIQIIDGQQVEVSADGEDEEYEIDEEDLDEADEETVGPDGQQYVVLEVIQMPEDEEDEDEESKDSKKKKPEKSKEPKPSTSKTVIKTEKSASQSDDVANCFGFDEVCN